MRNNNSRACFVLAYCLACALIVVLSSCTPPSRQAPVKRNVKQCLDCHPEFKGRYIKANIHQPVKEENCYACHRPHGLYGKIVFRVQQPQLCYACHPDTRPKASDTSVHAPVATDKCTVCHDSHNSDFGKLLKADGDASCFACHDREPYQNKYRHEPMASGCGTCHVPHSSENEKLLKLSADTTCRECHAVEENAFKKAHFDYPVENACVGCHTPHSSSDEKLLKKIVHEPVRKGKCDACHSVQGKAIGLTGQADKLCLACHSINGNGKSVHQPYVQGKCTSCHDAHASNFQVLLARPPEKVCLDCHAEKMGLSEKKEEPAEKEQVQTASKTLTRHQPFAEGQCLGCHLGHVSNQDSMLKKDLASLCYDCHQRKDYGGGSGSHPPAEPDRCDSCHVPHQSQVRMLLTGGREQDLCYTCHTDTANERGKFSLHKPFARGECGQCHQLHRPKMSSYLDKSYLNGDLCYSCHEKAGPGNAQFKSHKPVTTGQCSKCHLPHAADNEHVMRLPEGEQCFSCHQEVKNSLAGMKFPHQPVNDGQCTSCHIAHGSTYASILRKNQPALCISCHLDVAKFWLDGYKHNPAVRSCLQCHKSHGSDLPAVLTKPSGVLCSDCHDVTTGKFLNAHGQIKPRPDSCVTCHDSHGSPVKSMLYPVMHSPFKEGTCTPCHPGGKK